MYPRRNGKMLGEIVNSMMERKWEKENEINGGKKMRLVC